MLTYLSSFHEHEMICCVGWLLSITYVHHWFLLHFVEMCANGSVFFLTLSVCLLLLFFLLCCLLSFSPSFSSSPVAMFLCASYSPDQSIFMFPLSFSSSSSLSSIHPSLDSISELDRGLSDISEDDDLADDAAGSHTPWTLPSSTSSPISDQHLADITQNPPASCPITSTQIYSSELLGVEEGCHTRATAGIPKWWSWFSLRGVAKCVSFILCFLFMLWKNGNRYVPTKLSGLTQKFSFFTATVPKLSSESAEKFKLLTITTPKFITSGVTSHKFSLVINTLSLKLAQSVAFFTSYLPTDCSRFIPAALWHRTGLNFSSVSFLACPPIVSSFPPHTLAPLSCSNLTPYIHYYLLNPSPLFLPSLLVIFLLVVMLTASQSLFLALILATPLGLTLCYLENMVSSQSKLAILPMFAAEMSNDEPSNDFNEQAFPLTLKDAPPCFKHQGHNNSNWTQEKCDPAA